MFPLLDNDNAFRSFLRYRTTRELQTLALCEKAFRFPVYNELFTRTDSESLHTQEKILRYKLATIKQFSAKEIDLWLRLLPSIKTQAVVYPIWRLASILWFALQNASAVELSAEVAKLQFLRGENPLELSVLTEQVFSARGDDHSAAVLKQFNLALLAMSENCKLGLHHDDFVTDAQLNAHIVAMRTDHSLTGSLRKLINILSARSDDKALIKRVILDIIPFESWSSYESHAMRRLLRLLPKNDCKEILATLEPETSKTDLIWTIVGASLYPEDDKCYAIINYFIKKDFHTFLNFSDRILYAFALGLKEPAKKLELLQAMLSHECITNRLIKTYNHLFSCMSTDAILAAIDRFTKLESIRLLILAIDNSEVLASLMQKLVAHINDLNFPIFGTNTEDTQASAAYGSIWGYMQNLPTIICKLDNETIQVILDILLAKIRGCNGQNYRHPYIIFFKNAREYTITLMAQLILQLDDAMIRSNYLNSLIACINDLTHLGNFYISLICDIAVTIKDRKTLNAALRFLLSREQPTPGGDPLAMLMGLVPATVDTDDLLALATTLKDSTEQLVLRPECSRISFQIQDENARKQLIIQLLAETKSKKNRYNIKAIAEGLMTLSPFHFAEFFQKYILPLTTKAYYFLGLEILELCITKISDAGLCDDFIASQFNQVFTALDNNEKHVYYASLIALNKLVTPSTDSASIMLVAQLLSLVILQHRKNLGDVFSAADKVFDLARMTLQNLNPLNRIAVLSEFVSSSHYKHSYFAPLASSLVTTATLNDKTKALARIMSCTLTDVRVSLRRTNVDLDTINKSRQAFDAFVEGDTSVEMPSEFSGVFALLQNQAVPNNARASVSACSSK